MGIAFGNVHPDELARVTGWEFTPEEMAVLEDHYSENANPPADGKGWHVTNMPGFCAHISDKSIDAVLPILLRAYRDQSTKTPIAISPNTKWGQKRALELNKEFGNDDNLTETGDELDNE